MSDVSNIDPAEPADDVAASKQIMRNNSQGAHDYLAQLQDFTGGPYAGATTLDDEDHSLDGGATAATATRRLIIVNDTLTADRTLSLPTSGVDFDGVFGHALDNPAVPGAYYFIAYDLIRPAGSPAGSNDFIVGGLDGGARVLAAGEWIRIAYVGSAWRVIAYGSLSNSATPGGDGGVVTNGLNVWTAPQIVDETTQDAGTSPYVWDLGVEAQTTRILSASDTITLENPNRGGQYGLALKQGTANNVPSFGYSGTLLWMTPQPAWASQAAGVKSKVTVEAHAFADGDPIELWLYATEEG
jgi:hypothetical protein